MDSDDSIVKRRETCYSHEVEDTPSQEKCNCQENSYMYIVHSTVCHMHYVINVCCRYKSMNPSSYLG